MANNQQNFYTNPAFCQQSEYYNSQQRKCKSPPRNFNIRQPPVGAQAKIRLHDVSVDASKEECYEEQEFYEEMIVDDRGLIKDKKIVIVSSPQDNNYQQSSHRYEYIDDNINKGNRYEYIQEEQKSRSEYIPLKSQESVKIHKETVNVNSGRYALVPVEDLRNHRYAVITEDDIKTADRYEYIQEKPLDRIRQLPQNVEINKMISPRKANPIATQKLHELLSTPPRSQRSSNNSQKILSPQSPRTKTPQQQHQKEIFMTTPPKLSRSNSKVQQKLNYTIGARHQPLPDKRHTAIVAPICSSPVQSVYSETTFSQKTESWMNLSLSKPPVQATLAVAAIMMLMCGGVSFGLCLYMISLMGRLYYLDFGTIAGFTCLILGLMGFRTRNCYWLPNRNYISGKCCTVFLIPI